MKKKDLRGPEAKMKTMEAKVQTLRQLLVGLKEEAEESIKDYEPTNPFAVKVSGKIEGFRTAIELVDRIDHLKTKAEQRRQDKARGPLP
jgi:hypothetical protein